MSRHGKPFALSDIRIVDLSWMLASAGAGRYFAAMGAEVIKVEHVSHLDGMRYAPIGAYPAGGREERDRATGPIPPPPAERVSGPVRVVHGDQLRQARAVAWTCASRAGGRSWKT